MDHGGACWGNHVGGVRHRRHRLQPPSGSSQTSVFMEGVMLPDFALLAVLRAGDVRASPSATAAQLHRARRVTPPSGLEGPVVTIDYSLSSSPDCPPLPRGHIAGYTSAL